MPIDEAILNKSSEEVTGEDVRGLLNSPPDSEQPLVDAGIFEEQQPALPIYKSIPLKTALVSVFALIGMVPVMLFFAGNLLSGDSAATVASVEDAEESETEEEKAERLVVEENADLKRKLALQNQSFTAKEIEETTDAENSMQDQSQPIASASTASVQQPAPVTRPVAAVAPRPAPRPAPVVARAPVRPAPVAVSPARTATIPDTRQAARSPEPEPVNLAEIAAAGNYGRMPSSPMPSPASVLAVEPVNSTGSILSAVNVSNREVQVSRSGSIPISVRRQAQPATEAVSDSSNEVRRPMPMVMRDAALTVSASSKASEPATRRAAIDPKASDTYEAQRDLIMGSPTARQNAVSLPTHIMPGSAAQLEVTTAVTWASDLPKALGSLTLVSPLVSDGIAVIPAGTELVVQIGDLSASGAVSLDVVAMVLPGSNEIADVSIPSGALEVLAVGGGYPVASAEQSSERQLQTIDRQQALLGAMGGVGDYLNRPERETSVIGLGGSSSSREYGSGSLLGSLLSGAANEMLRSRATRLDEEADKLMERPTIWSIESGRQLQLFVTQEISL